MSTAKRRANSSCRYGVSFRTMKSTFMTSIMDDVKHAKLDDGVTHGISIDIKIHRKQVGDPFRIFAPEGNNNINVTCQARLGVVVQRYRTADHVGNISPLQPFSHQFQHIKLLGSPPLHLSIRLDVHFVHTLPVTSCQPRGHCITKAFTGLRQCERSTYLRVFSARGAVAEKKGLTPMPWGIHTGASIRPQGTTLVTLLLEGRCSATTESRSCLVCTPRC